ncbi:hypothetical protein Pint_15479 [Pistacia integerrima]|uniref:Uncharacterized protein n=1 Tax=Pistacia integerrima TaxID=434235 RepID=A0ACC0ZDL6_9ROSI|nr:hypothetical protein Pint_15479 [Pistacia integerrima]
MDVYALIYVNYLQYSAMRRSLLQAAPRVRRSSLSNLARGFYRQGHEYLSLDSNEYSPNSSSKLQHLAWHPAENLIACGSGNSLFLYHA